MHKIISGTLLVLSVVVIAMAVVTLWQANACEGVCAPYARTEADYDTCLRACRAYEE